MHFFFAPVTITPGLARECAPSHPPFPPTLVSINNVSFICFSPAGGVIESFVADRLRKSHTRLPGIVEKWKQETGHKAAEKHVPPPAALAALTPPPTRAGAAAAGTEPVVVEEDELWLSGGSQGFPTWQVVLIAVAFFAMGFQTGRQTRLK